MTRYNEDHFNISWVNENVKVAPDPVIYTRSPSSADTHSERRQRTTAYGLNEPQWTIGENIPPFITSLSPYTTIPLPPLFKIHPVLAFSTKRALDWTIDQPPDSAVLAVGYIHPDPYHWKSAPATNPATTTPIVIYIEQLNYHVTVSPMGRFVTVGDVLTAIYVGARRCVTERMLTRVRVATSILERFNDLVERMPRARGIKTGDDEVSSNVRESTDYWTKWVGLAPSATEDEVWCVYTKYLVD